jgi:hypothetical protein
MFRILTVFIAAALFGLPSAALAEDGVDQPAGTAVLGTTVESTDSEAAVEEDGTAEDWGNEVAELPPAHYSLEPVTKAWVGYRNVNVSGSPVKSMEYGWPQSSLAGGFNIHNYPLPQRFDAELDFLNKNDYEAELAYAYKDVFKLNYHGWALWHNLPHYIPTSGLVGGGQPTLNLDGEGVHYSVESRDNRVFLRLKWPERAYHAFVDLREYTKIGEMQSRFYSGTQKVSKRRDEDLTVRKLVAGMNGHFGPVEIEYSHMIKKFNPHDDVRLMDRVDNSGNGLGGATAVEHSVLPELEGFADTLKVHTDLTGAVVGNATLVSGVKKNNNSGTRVDYNRAYSDFTFIPATDVTVSLRYRYKELLENAPSTFGFTTGTLAVVPVPGIVVDPIDNRSNKAEMSIKYAPINAFMVKADYSFEDVKRKGADNWDNRATPLLQEPYEQKISTARIGVYSKPVRNLNLSGTLEYIYLEDPAFASKPRNEVKGRFSGEWVRGAVSSGVYYWFNRAQNTSVNLHEAYDNPGAHITWAPSSQWFLSCNYDYYRNVTDQTIQFRTGANARRTRIPNRDSANTYCISSGYNFAFPLYLEGEFRQTWAKGMWRSDLMGPSINETDVGQMNDVRSRETGAALTARYKFQKGWGTTLRYDVTNYEDFADLPQNGGQDGTGHAVMLTVSKEW